jgi:hypothetical protein
MPMELLLKGKSGKGWSLTDREKIEENGKDSVLLRKLESFD